MLQIHRAVVRCSAAFLVFALTGCAADDGRTLVPGRSSAAEVEALMGPPAYERACPGGERTVFYSRQPYGRQIYAARLGADGRLLALGPTLTEENIARLAPNRTRREEVLGLLGPPYDSTWFARQQREVWEYKIFGLPEPLQVLYVHLSPEGIVREVDVMDDPEHRRTTVDN